MVRAARLKVFVTSAGFDDALVAAPGRKAALQAWGARGDLFALGEAHEVDDPALADLALAKPGKVVRRPRGDVAAMLKSPSKPRAAKPKLDRSALDAAEAAVAAAEAELDRDLAGIAEERAQLDAREADRRRAGDRRLITLRKARDAAQDRLDAATRSST